MGMSMRRNWRGLLPWGGRGGRGGRVGACYRVYEDEGGEVAVGDSVALESHRDRVAIGRFKAERPWHLDVPGVDARRHT